MQYSYIIYDGDCGFCNKTVMFVARNDKNNTFKFISSLSEFGAKLLLKHNIKGLEKSTIILVENENEIYIKSVAIRKVLLKVPSYKMIGYLMFLFPKKLCDYVYDLISKNRKLIINNNICEVPNSEIRKKFMM
ncbi:MAG: thiol-disulfide oxidoreductase DCC family protein [Polaribacter sp.]